MVNVLAKVSTSTPMEMSMKANGLTIWNKAKVAYKWQLETNTKVNGAKARKTVQDYIYLPMGMSMKGNSKTVIGRVRVVIPGLTKATIKVSGWRIKWTGKESMPIRKFN
jgi:hypothetical protein